MVYGSGARGNWGLLLRLAASGAPLPFGSIHNRRSLIAGENLADAVVWLLSLSSEALRPGVYMVSDDGTVSLTEIFTWLRSAMGMSPRLLPVRAEVLRAILRMVGKEKMAKRLFDDLQIDSTLFRETFGWSPKIGSREGITRSGAGFLARNLVKQRNESRPS
jgi:UDP-glucose 4-epimerase